MTAAPSLVRKGSWVVQFSETGELLLNRLDSKTELLVRSKSKALPAVTTEAASGTPPSSPPQPTSIAEELTAPPSKKRNRDTFEDEATQAAAEPPAKRQKLEDGQTSVNIPEPPSVKWEILTVQRWRLENEEDLTTELLNRRQQKLLSEKKKLIGADASAVPVSTLKKHGGMVLVDDHPALTPPSDGVCYFDFLSDEVILNVFEYLEERDILACRCVCYLWHAISQEPTLWKNTEVEIKRTSIIHPYYRWKTTSALVVTLSNAASDSSVEPLGYLRAPSSLDSLNNSWVKYWEQTSIYRFNDSKNWRWSCLYRPPTGGSGKSGPATDLGVVEARVWCNIGRLEHTAWQQWRKGALSVGLPPAAEELLITMATARPLIKWTGITASSVPFTPTTALPESGIVAVTQPPQIATRLHDYQLESLSWMCHIEKLVDTGEPIGRVPLVVPWALSQRELGTFSPDSGDALPCQLGIDIERGSIVYGPAVDETRRQDAIEWWTRGGILADEMGLGKTVTVLALVATRSIDGNPDEFPLEFDPPELLIDPSPPVAAADTAAAAESTTTTTEKQRPLKRDDDTLSRLKSRATLVICPSHLVKQWTDEAAKHVKSPLKVLTITRISEYRKLSYYDLATADLVLVSVQFLCNINYYRAHDGLNSVGFNHLRHSDRRIQMLCEAKELTKIFRENQSRGRGALVEGLGRRSPMLELIKWHRIIADEGHEMLANDTLRLIVVNHYSATYHWYVTGTPFPKAMESLAYAADLLQADCRMSTSTPPPLKPVKAHASIPPHRIADEEKAYNETTRDRERREVDLSIAYTDQYISLPFSLFIPKVLRAQYLARSLIDTLYHRHTKASVECEVVLAGVEEELHLLEQQPLERVLCNLAKEAGDFHRMRQLCCHLQLSDDDVEALGSASTKNLDQVRAGFLKAKSAALDEVKAAIPATEQDIEQTKRDLAALTTRITHCYAPLPYEENRISALRKRLVKLPCKLERLRVQQAFLEKEISEVTATPKPSSLLDTAHNETHRLIYKYGTKLASLVAYVRDLLGADDKARLIIFSQWHRLLVHVGGALEWFGIDNVFCKGNVVLRNKAIHSFRSACGEGSGIRVIMLSLESSASGTNLTEATHIILLDPVGNSQREALAIEAQAIGRAYRIGQKNKVKVVRFVVKDTIEYELYLRNRPIYNTPYSTTTGASATDAMDTSS